MIKSRNSNIKNSNNSKNSKKNNNKNSLRIHNKKKKRKMMRINSAVIGPHVTAGSDRSATITCQEILSAILSIAENRFLSVELDRDPG